MTTSQALSHPLHTNHRQHEQALLERARGGEDVREDIVLHLHTISTRMAWRLYRRMSPGRRQAISLEVNDLIQAASVAVLDQYANAMTKEHPLPWLLRVAQRAMWSQINGRGDLIKRHPSERPVLVLRLDRPLAETGETLADVLPSAMRFPDPCANASVTLLEQAISTLPEKQRMVIECHFGLNQHEPRSLSQVAREMYPANTRPNSTRYYKQALSSLQHLLLPLTSPHADLQGGGK